MQNSIQLQSVGRVPAKMVSEFKIGEFIGWNFGFKSEILGIVKETKSQIIFRMSSIDPFGKVDGKVHERRMNKNRLAAIAK